MTAPFLALITPIGETVTPPQPPLGIWGPTDPRPTHPIVVPPGGAWPPGPGSPVDPGYSPPWARPQPPYPDQGLPRPPGYPTHPIYNPAYPDQGLPGNQPYPDQGLPGNQPYPDQGLPGHQPRPSHPIYFPPEITGPNDPRPTPPIAIPPDLPEEIPEGPINWKVGWTAQTGWVVVGIPQFPMPTPSR